MSAIEQRVDAFTGVPQCTDERKQSAYSACINDKIVSPPSIEFIFVLLESQLFTPT